MRIVCAWTQLEPATREALDNCGHPVTYEYVGHSDTAYPEMIASLWKGRGWINVEQDIVVTPEIIDAMAKCSDPFCAGVYEWGTNCGPALGLVKFDAPLLADCPTAADEALGHSYRQYDFILLREILAKKYGKRPHVHLPPVVHLNPAKSPLWAPFDQLSLDEHLAELGWVRDSETTAVYHSGAYG